MYEGVYKPVETYIQSTRSMVLGVLGVALCVSGCSGCLQSGEHIATIQGMANFHASALAQYTGCAVCSY